MLNPRSRDRWRKRGQTALPISGGAGLGAIIMANSPPPGPGSRKRSETGKVEPVQCLNTFRCRICLDLVYCLTLSIFCLTGNCWWDFPLSTHHETSSMYFRKIAKLGCCLARAQWTRSIWLKFQWLKRRFAEEKHFYVQSARKDVGMSERTLVVGYFVRVLHCEGHIFVLTSIDIFVQWALQLFFLLHLHRNKNVLLDLIQNFYYVNSYI